MVQLTFEPKVSNVAAGRLRRSLDTVAAVPVFTRQTMRAVPPYILPADSVYNAHSGISAHAAALYALHALRSVTSATMGAPTGVLDTLNDAIDRMASLVSLGSCDEDLAALLLSAVQQCTLSQVLAPAATQDGEKGAPQSTWSTRALYGVSTLPAATIVMTVISCAPGSPIWIGGDPKPGYRHRRVTPYGVTFTRAVSQYDCATMAKAGRAPVWATRTPL